MGSPTMIPLDFFLISSPNRRFTNWLIDQRSELMLGSGNCSGWRKSRKNEIFESLNLKNRLKRAGFRPKMGSSVPSTSNIQFL